MATNVEQEKTLNGVAAPGRASKPMVVWNGASDRQSKCFSLVQRSYSCNPATVAKDRHMPTRLERLLPRTRQLQM